MPRPTEMPVGLALMRSSKLVERAFDDALGAAGSTRPTWLIVMTLHTSKPATQVELAEAVGIHGATLSHHLNAMDRDGLITRERNPTNRRVHQVALTASGEALFERLVGVVQEHDRRLRLGLDAADVTELNRLLKRVRANVATRIAATPAPQNG